MYCQKCGTENLENAAICQNCGGVFVYSKPIRTSGMAITSMILGISGFSVLGVFGITWIIGLIFGIFALSKIGKSGGSLKGKGFAITGIATSATGLAIVLTILGVMMFYTSFKTVSLSKELGLDRTIDADAVASVQGMVEIETTDGTVCSLPLFDPNAAERQAEFTTVLACQAKLIEAKWQFIGKKDQSDVYDFVFTLPIGENSSAVSEKRVYFKGKPELIYESTKGTVSLLPADDGNEELQIGVSQE